MPAFSHGLMRTTGSEQLIPAESAKDIQLNGFCKNEQGGISNDYEVRLKYDTSKDYLVDAPIAAKGNGKAEARINHKPKHEGCSCLLHSSSAL